MTTNEAAARLAADGPNELPRGGRRRLPQILRDALTEAMFALLLGSGVIYLVPGDTLEAVLLLVFASLSVGIAVIQKAHGAQPWYSPLAILTALTLRAVFRLALRQTEGLIASIVELLGLNLAVPDHSTLSRRAKKLEVPRPRSGNGAAAPVHLLVDSTELKLCSAGEWLLEKYDAMTRRSWGSFTLAWTPTRARSSPLS